jgi:hypothetical protein
VRPAFDDAGNGRGVERGGNGNGSWREGELADVRQRSSKRQRDNLSGLTRGEREVKA